MVVLQSSAPLEWGSIDLPLSGVLTDWYGNPLSPPAAFALARDATHLWFIAGRDVHATVHPCAPSGSFTPRLWLHDTAELFLTSPDSTSYIELNLTANGAWWACFFSGTREPAETQPDFQRYIVSHHDEDREGSWLAAISIPLHLLMETIGLGEGSCGNVAFILNSPCQTFHSAYKLPGQEPDFHQPSAMPRLKTTTIK